MELKSGGDVAGAIAAFRRAIELKPDFEKAHYNLGMALRAQGQKTAAEVELNQLKELHDSRAHLAQAKLLTLQGVDALREQNLDAAMAFFNKAIEQAPELPTGHYYLGVTWQRKNDPERAHAAFEKALELKPDYAQAHASMGLLYWAQNDQTRAIEEFRQAVMSVTTILGSLWPNQGRQMRRSASSGKRSVLIQNTSTLTYSWDWSSTGTTTQTAPPMFSGNSSGATLVLRRLTIILGWCSYKQAIGMQRNRNLERPYA